MLFASNPNVGISSTIQIFAFNIQDFFYFSGSMYFDNTIKSRLLLSTILYLHFFLQQFRFIVLSKYILPEKYKKSGMLKAKIWIVEEMPTFGFDAHNNLDF